MQPFSLQIIETQPYERVRVKEADFVSGSSYSSDQQSQTYPSMMDYLSPYVLEGAHNEQSWSGAFSLGGMIPSSPVHSAYSRHGKLAGRPPQSSLSGFRAIVPLTRSGLKPLPWMGDT